VRTKIGTSEYFQSDGRSLGRLLNGSACVSAKQVSLAQAHTEKRLRLYVLDSADFAACHNNLSTSGLTATVNRSEDSLISMESNS
jgi:hypothetical protein